MPIHIYYIHLICMLEHICTDSFLSILFGSDLSLISVLSGSELYVNHTDTPEIADQILPLGVSKITAEHNAISIFISQICQDTRIVHLITWISILGLERQKSSHHRELGQLQQVSSPVSVDVFWVTTGDTGWYEV